MKKILILLMALCSFSILASERNEYCVAKKIHDIGYGSSMFYSINCSDGKKYETDPILTTLLIPIPYQWSKVAKKKLNKFMSAKGFQEVADLLHDNQGDHTGYLVFSKKNRSEEFMLVRAYEKKNQGLDGLSNFSVITSSTVNGVSSFLYEALADSDINIVADRDGFSKRIFSFHNPDMVFYNGPEYDFRVGSFMNLKKYNKFILYRD